MIEVAAVSWIYGLKRFTKDIEFMLNVSVGIYWKFCWGFFVPFCLFCILIYFLATYEPLTYQGKPYPALAEYAGYGLTTLAIMQLPIWLIHALYKAGRKEARTIFSPTSEWGPARQEVREEWQKMDWEMVTKL